MGSTIKKEFEQHHTEEVQEIISSPPSWLLRWGIVMFFSILTIIIGLSALIKYPDMIKTNLKIQSFDLPETVKLNAPGKIIRLLVQNNTTVYAGQALAIIRYDLDSAFLISPKAGKLRYAGIVHQNQQFPANKNIFYLIDANKGDFFGEMTVPQNSIDKVKEGQDVIVMLKGYPYQEYGILHGTIKYISEENYQEGGYVAEVDFKTKSLTDNHKYLDLKQGMMGDAEVITQNISLFNRLTENLFKNLNH